MVGRVKAYFHNLRLLGDESLSCPACERQIPADGDYCLWCGVDLAHAFRYREDLETEVTVPDADVSEVVIMALAAGRRKRPHPDSARALYAFEAMHVDRPEQPVLECLSRLDLTPLDYQAETAANVIGRLRGRAILADEVGLGKTIEAGLVLKELLVRGLARQVLICVPSSLVEQWRGELIDKFDIVPATHEDRFYWRKRIVLLSLSRAKLPHVARRLLRRSWDLLIVDEAHSLKNARTRAHRFIRQLRTRRMLLLTATPIENDLRELYNLLVLLDPAVYPTFRRFAKDFLESRFKVKDAQALRRFCLDYMVRNRRIRAFPELPPRHPRLIVCSPSLNEQNFLDQSLMFVRRVYGNIKSVPRLDGPAQDRKSSRAAATMLFITLLLKESCSSPEAVLSTVRNVMLPVMGEEEECLMERLQEAGAAIVQTGKMEAFLQEMRRISSAPVVVYVEFFATHQKLTKLLEAEGFNVIPYTGHMTTAEKQLHIEKFRSHGGVLLSTEVGGQGLNLQHCNIVVNFDIPWNPMRLEQRIGRVHRYGQDKAIEVLNFVTRGTYEEHIYSLLAQKLELFTQAVGQVEAILSYVEEEESMQQMVARAICEATSGEDLEANFRSLTERLAEAEQRYRRSRDATARFFDVGSEQ